MLYWTTIKVALKSIAANKLRSILTMLGVIIGVSAVIAMLGLGAGTKQKVTESVRNLGANLVIIRSAQARAQGANTGTANTLTLERAEVLLRDVPEIEAVVPDVSGRYQAKFDNKNTNVNVVGAPVTYFAVRNFVVEKGAAFTEADVERNMRVCILGPKTATDLFDTQDPVGQTIKIKGSNYLVKGVTKSKGDQGWFNPDDQIVIPISTAMKQLMGRDTLGSIYAQIRQSDQIPQAIANITTVLRREHRLQADQEDDFQIRNLQEIRDSLDKVTSIFSMLLAGVAAVSLLVGGIGIMNIMLVSVTERTREIGVRKALGARRRDVMSQFLLESVTLSVTGGIIGVLLGTGIIVGSNYYTRTFGDGKDLAMLQAWPIVLSFFFSVLVGVFFGFYPARKASGLNPIDALRYE